MQYLFRRSTLSSDIGTSTALPVVGERADSFLVRDQERRLLSASKEELAKAGFAIDDTTMIQLFADRGDLPDHAVALEVFAELDGDNEYNLVKSTRTLKFTELAPEEKTRLRKKLVDFQARLNKIANQRTRNMDKAAAVGV